MMSQMFTGDFDFLPFRAHLTEGVRMGAETEADFALAESMRCHAEDASPIEGAITWDLAAYTWWREDIRARLMARSGGARHDPRAVIRETARFLAEYARSN